MQTPEHEAVGFRGRRVCSPEKLKINASLDIRLYKENAAVEIHRDTVSARM